MESRGLCLGKLLEEADCAGEAPPPEARVGREQNSSWPDSCLGPGRHAGAARLPRRSGVGAGERAGARPPPALR